MRQEVVIEQKENLDNTRRGEIQNPSLGHLYKDNHPMFKEKEHDIDIRAPLNSI